MGTLAESPAWTSRKHRLESLGHVLLAVAGLSSVGAAVIHFAVTPEHYQEFWGFGIFFLVVGWLQLGWAALVALRPVPSVIAAGALVNLLVALIWTVSRTIGIPLGPEPGTAEVAGLTDVMATAFELTLVGAAVAWLAPGIRSLTLSLRAVVTWMIVVVAGVVMLTSWALAMAPSEGTGHGSDAGNTRTTFGSTWGHTRGRLDETIDCWSNMRRRCYRSLR